MNTTRTDNVEYHRGVDDAKAGKTLESNPYTADGERATRWALGWTQTRPMMPTTTRIIEHIETSAGARFSVYTSSEDRRVQLIQYYNEVHADSEGDELFDHATLEQAIDAIEEIENISAEEICIPMTAAEAAPAKTIADEALRDRARDLYETDDIEIDDEPATSPNDHGVWVAAWVHVQSDAQDDEA